MTQKRKQLTLFIEGIPSKVIEEIRWKYNPLQYELIKSHVTLCREDEIENLEKVLDNLSNLDCEPISLELEKIQRHSGGNGVLITMNDIHKGFQNLRAIILAGSTFFPRNHKPHVTLMHPRNSKCNNEVFEEISVKKLPTSIRFSKISLIEQELGKKWMTLKEFKLRHHK